MPLPLIPAIVAIATAGGVAHGAKKGIEAKQDMDRASQLIHRRKILPIELKNLLKQQRN